MSATRSASSCTFTFSDGRRCRSLRQSGHPLFCSMHARRHDRVGTAETLGREFAQFFSRRYLSACDLNAALGSLFTATVRGHVPPKTTRTLAYLAQVMVQCIRLTEHEYADTYGGDGWRRAVHNSVNSNFDYRSPAAPAFHTDPSIAATPNPAVSAAGTAPPRTAKPQPPASVEAGLQPGLSSNSSSACVGVGLHPGPSSNLPLTPFSSSAPPPTLRPAESPQASQSVAPRPFEKPALNLASLASAVATLQPAPLQPALTSNLPVQPCAPPASSPSAVSSTTDVAFNQSSTSGSFTASLKSQLKHLLVSELSKHAAPRPTSSQSLQSAPKVTLHPTNTEQEVDGEEEMDGDEEMDDDGEEDFDSRAQVPALRRRSWRERV